MSVPLFPFWVISKPSCIPSLVLVSEGTLFSVAAFKSQESAIEFMSGQHDWEFTLVCRESFRLLAVDLWRFGVQTICFEPDSRGHGDRISVDELRRFSAPSAELKSQSRAATA